MTPPQTTRLRMLDCALDLFHRQGVNATSVDEVLKKSKTGKSQFTHYFQNKEGMVRATIKHLANMIETGQTPTGYDVKTWSDLTNWFQTYIDFQDSIGCERSCPVGTLGADLFDQKARGDVINFLDWSRHQLAKFFSERKAAGELSATANPQELADFCIAVMQGGMLLSKIRRDTKMFQNAAAQALNYIETLRPRN